MRSGLQTTRWLLVPAWVLPPLAAASPAPGQTYPVVDTAQEVCYDASGEALEACPPSGQPLHGQDASYAGNRPRYAVGAEGRVVHDLVTGLTWTRSPDTDGDGEIDSSDKLSWVELQDHPALLNGQVYGGFDDWRVPTIKELYSLIDFRGTDPSDCPTAQDCPDIGPFLDVAVFDFGYGDTSAGERLIDAQYWSATEYVGTVFGGDAAVFGVNFADGRIKGYPRDSGPGGTMTQYVRLVRGNPAYGVNEFHDNGDLTVTDLATGLVWQQADSGAGLDWESALAHCEDLPLATCDDWRLPDAKELQSVVDYSRSPGTTGSAAIAPVFDVSSIVDGGGGENFPFYWSGTTHANWTAVPGAWAAYVAFGEALGWMQVPFPPGALMLQDVQGAGAQRSDPKSGGPADWPNGHGPQGDVVRVYNHVRCVRGDAVPPCEIRVEGAGGTAIDLHPTCPAQSMAAVTGVLSELRSDRDFRSAACLGSFAGTAVDDGGVPPSGDGVYYLIAGTGACASRGYGDARGTVPEPRDDLETLDPCR